MRARARFDGVLSEIQSALTPTPDPSPQGGGERAAFEASAEPNHIPTIDDQDPIHL
jgi:hypothetical protein